MVTAVMICSLKLPVFFFSYDTFFIDFQENFTFSFSWETSINGFFFFFLVTSSVTYSAFGLECHILTADSRVRISIA